MVMVGAPCSVVVGWSSSVVIQYVWQPTVWDENGITVLRDTDLWCMAWACNSAPLAATRALRAVCPSRRWDRPMQARAYWAPPVQPARNWCR